MTNSGLIEIFGSLIQAGIEQNKNSESIGYYFVGRLWDEAYINEIENVVAANIVIQSPNDNIYKTNDISIISTISILKDWKNQTVAKILVNKEHLTLKKLKAFNNFVSVFLMFFILVLLVIIIISFQRFITLPLLKIEQALNTEDLTGLKKIIKKDDEFGRISELIEEFLKQRKLLYDEISERKATEKALKASENKYKNLLDNIAHGVFRSSQEGRFVEVNKALYKLLGYDSEEEMMSIDVLNDFLFFS